MCLSSEFKNATGTEMAMVMKMEMEMEIVMDVVMGMELGGWRWW